MTHRHRVVAYMPHFMRFPVYHLLEVAGDFDALARGKAKARQDSAREPVLLLGYHWQSSGSGPRASVLALALRPYEHPPALELWTRSSVTVQ